MLRECARYEALAKIMLHSEDFFNFFRYVEVSTFDIASDAFSTFKVKVSLCVFKLGPMQFFFTKFMERTRKLCFISVFGSFLNKYCL